jgi:hypothetical protein
MTTFQWDRSHVDWFLKRFSSASMDIDARIVSQNYYRKKGESKPNSQDFNHLMRLIVQSKLARVSNGSVWSKGYKIRMVSETHPYTEELFDKEFFCHPLWESIVPKVDEVIGLNLETSGSDIELEGWRTIAKGLRASFYSYNYHGSDYDLVMKKCDSRGGKHGINRESFCLTVKEFVQYYRVLKLADVELAEFLKDGGVLPVSCGDKKIDIHINAKDRNELFLLILRSWINFEILREVDSIRQPSRRSGRTNYNRIMELIEDRFNSDDSSFSPNNETIAIHSIYSFWKWIPSISINPKVLEAVNNYEEDWLSDTRRSARRWLTHTNKAGE